MPKETRFPNAVRVQIDDEQLAYVEQRMRAEGTTMAEIFRRIIRFTMSANSLENTRPQETSAVR